MVVAEVLLFVRLSVQFQELKAEKHPKVAVVRVFVLGAVSTGKIIIMIRAILPSQIVIKKERVGIIFNLPTATELANTRRTHTNNTGAIMTG